MTLRKRKPNTTSPILHTLRDTQHSHGVATILKPQNADERTGKICKLVVDLKPDNMFNTIEIDRINLTIMGVKFSDLKTLESTANALGSNMFEGFKPTPKGIEIIRDYVTGKISFSELVTFAKEKTYV